MCDFGDDRPEVWRTSIQAARKPYQCDECRREIKIGERYVRDFWVFDGDVGGGITCSHCLVARKWLIENCGGFSPGLEDLMREHAEEYPGLEPELTAVAEGISRRWDGGTMPVPPMPRSIASTLEEAG